MANAKLKLYYFDLKARAEVARLLLAAARKPYEDIRWPKEEWATYKSSAPFGQAPWLEVNGEKFAQSIAINNFLAREFGFYGKTNLEGLKIDQIVQLADDMAKAVRTAYQAKGEMSEPDIRKKLQDEVTAKFLTFFEQLLKDSRTGYFVGDKLSLADITLFDIATGTMAQAVNFDKFPLLKKNTELVRANDNIRQYLASRKETEY